MKVLKTLEKDKVLDSCLTQDINYPRVFKKERNTRNDTHRRLARNLIAEKPEVKDVLEQYQTFQRAAYVIGYEKYELDISLPMRPVRNILNTDTFLSALVKGAIINEQVFQDITTLTLSDAGYLIEKQSGNRVSNSKKSIFELLDSLEDQLGNRIQYILSSISTNNIDVRFHCSHEYLKLISFYISAHFNQVLATNKTDLINFYNIFPTNNPIFHPTINKKNLIELYTDEAIELIKMVAQSDIELIKQSSIIGR